MRPAGGGPGRSPTTPNGAWTRSRCASGSPTSWTSSPAKMPTPRSSLAGRGRPPGARQDGQEAGGGPAREDLIALIGELTEQMHTAAAELQFEIAARLRDEVKELKHEL